MFHSICRGDATNFWEHKSPFLPLYMEQYLISILGSSVHKNHLKQIHTLVLRKYPGVTPIFVRRLLDLSIVYYARLVFDQIPQPDEFLCSSIISSYSKLSLNKEAVEMFCSIHRDRTRTPSYAFPPVLRSCASLLAIKEGKQIHSLVMKYGFISNVFVQTALIDMYAKTSDLHSAKQVFDEIVVRDPVAFNCLISGYSKSGEVFAARNLFDEMTERTVVSWNSMISCYARNGYLHEALRIFERMQAEKFLPNEMTLVTILSICAKLGDLEMGLRVKKLIDQNKLCINMIVSTAILEMYVKCGAVDEARLEFDRMVERDVIAWSAMITGYAQNGRPNEALELFDLMRSENVQPNDVTLVSALSSCAQLGSVEAGERIGNLIESEGLILNVYVCSALIDMYAKCGNIRKAQQVFDRVTHRDIVSWNSIIGGLAVNGFAEDAITLYNKMKETEVKPNDITFVSLLTACTHAGLVELGLGIFKSMRSDHNIIPKVEHCACIVDLFCRSGRLQEAYEFICQMEVEPNAVIWGSLLSASRASSRVELAEQAVEKLLVLEPENSSNYVLLSNIYANVGRWQEALEVRKRMIGNRVQKTAAYSWIEVDNRMHKFLVGDTSHPGSDEIYCVIDGLGMQLNLASHVPNSELELLNLDISV
ncbi:pentatricopeptide repeat-containing protein At1g08070, chloroplastic-like [Macadamia integrifolia]|uniref:pentatricopeptide repeat-containing protein At1g08070, chloroplastic-like n=1 Tax=Macadamia integrifolia TaxID=60698 RepID=UPI001C52C5F3|nr:pentatricopeptide repeat-containing protein At1g08070, chloroplastic-like [Macadamia integrifolia]